MRRQAGGNVESCGFDDAGQEVVHHDIGLTHEPLQEPPVVGLPKVEGDRSLVAIDAQEIRRFAARVEGGPPTACIVTTAGALDLDDVGPEVTEEHGGEGSGENASEIEDLELSQ